MLVLSRRRDERIHIGQNVTVTVLRFWGNRVSLGIDAPRGVSIVRDDVTPQSTATPTGENPAAPAFRDSARS